ncbi:MAG TPA: hypothetical protein PLL69_03650 [Gemmatimonadales bacterium]|nr:hypothetical protein [Gemmatimonadales bacterium]
MLWYLASESETYPDSTHLLELIRGSDTVYVGVGDRQLGEVAKFWAMGDKAGSSYVDVDGRQTLISTYALKDADSLVIVEVETEGGGSLMSNYLTASRAEWNCWQHMLYALGALETGVYSMMSGQFFAAGAAFVAFGEFAKAIAAECPPSDNFFVLLDQYLTEYPGMVGRFNIYNTLPLVIRFSFTGMFD